MGVPNMWPELLEAIHLYHEDEPSVEIDCLLYLKGLGDNPAYVSQLSAKAYNKLEEMDCCPSCGEPMQYHHHKEPHPELEGCPTEEIVEKYCPNCDMGQYSLFD